jgi:hypothetical protein
LPAAAKSDAPFIYDSRNLVIVTFLRDMTLAAGISADAGLATNPALAQKMIGRAAAERAGGRHWP